MEKRQVGRKHVIHSGCDAIAELGRPEAIGRLFAGFQKYLGPPPSVASGAAITGAGGFLDRCEPRGGARMMGKLPGEATTPGGFPRAIKLETTGSLEVPMAPSG